MKRTALALAALTTALASGIAAADQGCDAAAENRQSREALRQQLETRGWSVDEIEREDGCYEVEGVDPSGRSVEAYFAPDTLRLVAREEDEDDDEDDDDEGALAAPAGDAQPSNGLVKARPSVSIQ